MKLIDWIILGIIVVGFIVALCFILFKPSTCCQDCSHCPLYSKEQNCKKKRVQK